MIQHDSLERLALETAVEAHAGQCYGTRPYIYHPLTVANIVRSWGYGSTETTCAVLHDVVEDTRVNTQALYERGFPLIVVWTVDCLSLSGGTREAKVARAIQQPVSRVVKTADATHNRDSCLADGDVARAAGYQRSIDQLRDPQLPTPKEVADFIEAFNFGIPLLEQKLGMLMLESIESEDTVPTQIPLYETALRQRRAAEKLLSL